MRLLLPIPWCVFAFVSARRAGAAVPAGWRVAFAAGSAALALAAAGAFAWPMDVVPVVDGPFVQAPLTRGGQLATIVEILATIAVLYGLEPSIRNSYGSTRWRVKYLALGLVGIFVVRFYLLSQTLLIPVLTAEALRTSVVTLAVGFAFVGLGLLRTGGLGSDLAVSRHFVYRSIAVAVAGAYLVLAGLAGWLLNALGLPDKAVWGTLVLFLSIMGLAAFGLSESVRWRVKRYISTHFYADKYDYRQQWRSFTIGLGSRVTLEAVIAQLLRSVVDTMGTTRAALYLLEVSGGALRESHAVGCGRLPQTIDLRWEDFAGRDGLTAMPAGAVREGRGEPVLAAGLTVAVPLPSQGKLLGVLLVGSERTEAAYAQEDLDLLTTLGEQAASAVATARLSEQLAQARAFEAFSRLTSFVVHDLKNSTAALSLLAQNARVHLDNPEFQKDAVRTLGRTVERMQQLLGRLSSRQLADDLTLEPVDLGELARETSESTLRGGRVELHLEIAETPLVAADPDAIQRVIQNLIRNAVEAMDGEGRITIRCAARDRMVACAVTDTGCGMSDEFIRKSLFVPFQTTKKGGWGIGLYQARETVVSHGGQLEVTSQEGQGTTITLLLPVEHP
jgi:signal transduction histidine kinase